MSDLDDAVARVRAVLAANAEMLDEDDTSIVGLDSFTYGDLRTLLAAYESAVHERNEARVIAVSIAVQEHDSIRAALRRVRDEAAVNRREVRPEPFATPDEAYNEALDDVLSLLDREAPDAT